MPRLFFDAAKRADRDVLFRMRNRHSAQLHRVLELDVAALLSDPLPAIRQKLREDLAAGHDVFIHTELSIRAARQTKPGGAERSPGLDRRGRHEAGSGLPVTGSSSLGCRADRLRYRGTTSSGEWMRSL